MIWWSFSQLHAFRWGLNSFTWTLSQPISSEQKHGIGIIHITIWATQDLSESSTNQPPPFSQALHWKHPAPTSGHVAKPLLSQGRQLQSSHRRGRQNPKDLPGVDISPRWTRWIPVAPRKKSHGATSAPSHVIGVANDLMCCLDATHWYVKYDMITLGQWLSNSWHQSIRTHLPPLRPSRIVTCRPG